MSKIGRRPIELGSVAIELKDNELHYKGKYASGLYILPPELGVEIDNKKLKLVVKRETRDINRLWGLHRALIANCVKGAESKFQKQLKINGLGFKGVLNGRVIQFSLGYSHKIDFNLPENVNVEIDKTGQLLTFDSFDKIMLGQVCSTVRALRPPEPYKGTGIKYVTEVILRKEGKAKSSK